MNGGAPRAFAEALLESGGRLLQVSTDFVFNGQQGSPYRPGQGVILRTSWVIGPVGKTFALTMLRLHRERGASCQALGVVEDQVGCMPIGCCQWMWGWRAAGGCSPLRSATTEPIC